MHVMEHPVSIRTYHGLPFLSLIFMGRNHSLLCIDCSTIGSMCGSIRLCTKSCLCLLVYSLVMHLSVDCMCLFSFMNALYIRASRPLNRKVGRPGSFLGSISFLNMSHLLPPTSLAGRITQLGELGRLGETLSDLPEDGDSSLPGICLGSGMLSFLL